MNTSPPISTVAMASYDQFHLSTTERRIRNRSLCSLLWTPPLYPGYSAKLDKSLKSNFYQKQWKSTVSEITTLSNPVSPNCTTNPDFHSSSTQNRNMINATYPFKRKMPSQLQSSENEDIGWNSPKKYTNSKESSGYGSGTSESDLENEQQTRKTLETVTDSSDTITNINSNPSFTMNDNCDDIFEKQKIEIVGRATTRSPIRQQHNRQHTLEKNRRRSVPANLRNAFTDEIARVLEINGVFQYETDADTGIRRPIVREQSINRPESVIQLARKFAEASA
ncbi:unnamed protein product, partial [Acanthocheilonema viteae]